MYAVCETVFLEVPKSFKKAVMQMHKPNHTTSQPIPHDEFVDLSQRSPKTTPPEKKNSHPIMQPSQFDRIPRVTRKERGNAESVIKPCKSFSLPNWDGKWTSNNQGEIQMMDTEVNAVSSPYDTSAQALGFMKQKGINC